ncbi:MAG: magnesium/cobalt transporter CorA [Bacteroidota bacterium]
MSFLSFIKNPVSQKGALPPGTMTYVGEVRQAPVSGTFFHFQADTYEEGNWIAEDWGKKPRPEGMTTWVNLNGVHDLSKVKALGDGYGLHPLVLEDIVNTTQRPSLESYEEGLYLVMNMLNYDGVKQELQAEQISLFLSNNLVLTFQERAGDVFDPVRNRIRQKIGRVRQRGADYLFYCLIEIMVRQYFQVLEGIEKEMEVLEERLYQEKPGEILQDIQQLKRNLILFRKHVLPLREVMSHLSREGEYKEFEARTTLFVRDLQGELMQVLDLAETFRDILANLFDLHFALNGQRMNEIMKVLTIVSTIFIPLTFIAGIYGMNFQYMPELGWQPGYFTVLGSFLVIAGGLLYLFRRKGWL